jgi:hypothetical protein
VQRKSVLHKRPRDNKRNVRHKKRLHVSRQSKPLPQHAPRNKLRANRSSLQRRPALVRKRRSHGKILSALAATKKPVVPKSSADSPRQKPHVARKKKPLHRKWQGKKPRVKKRLVLHRSKPQPSARRRSFVSRSVSERQHLFVSKRHANVRLVRKRARRSLPPEARPRIFHNSLAPQPRQP